MKQFDNILQLCEKLSTEAKCIEFFINLRWKDGVECPHCQSKKIYTLKNGKSFRCGNVACRETFSIRTGTVMEASNISIKKWFMAIYFLTCSAKGISSNQLGKELGISQKSAWFMLHRIREVKGIKFNSSGSFSGTVEVDECYVGGSESNKHTSKKFKTEKSIIIGLVNRETKQAKAFKIDNADKECLLPKIGSNVKEKSTIVTDTYHAYNNLRRNYTHKTVKHSANESMRYNSRETSEGLRLNDIMSNLNGRLSYKQLVAKV